MMSFASPNPYESPITAQLATPAAVNPDAGVVREGDNWVLHYRIEQHDLVNFGLHHYMNAPANRRARRMNLVAVPLIFLAMAIPAVMVVSRALGAGGDLMTLFPLLGLIIVVLLVLTVLRSPARMRGLVRKQLERLYADGTSRSIIGPHRLLITPAMLIITAPLLETHYHWQAIERIEQTPEYLFLYISALNGIIIPAAAFRSQQERAEFVAALEAHRQAKTP